MGIGFECNIHTLIKGRKKWRPRRHSPNQPRAQGGRRGGLGGCREGGVCALARQQNSRLFMGWHASRTADTIGLARVGLCVLHYIRKEVTASWKKFSRAWAIGSTKAMRKRSSSSKANDNSLGQSRRYPRRLLSKTPGAKLGMIRR